MHQGRLAVLAAALGALSGCGSSDRPAFAASLDTRMPGLLTTYRVPGAAVVLIEDGALSWTGGYGMAVSETQTPVSAATVFQVASLSKSVAAWGAQRLAEKGVLDRDAPVERYLTRWHLPPSGFDAGGVTVRRLLSHTAGLSIHGYDGYLPDSRLPSLEQSLLGDTGYRVVIQKEPGAEWSYSGGGFTVLQLVMEEIAKEPFAAFMQREVLNPLGMTHSAYQWDAALRPNTAAAYDPSGRRVPNYLFVEQAAAGLYTTAEDLGRFVAAGMPGAEGAAGRGVLAPASVSLLHTPAAVTGGEYGLGHVVYPLPSGSSGVGHDGANIGWRALWSSVPSRGVGIAVLTNSDNGYALAVDVVCSWYTEVVSVSPRLCG